MACCRIGTCLYAEVPEEGGGRGLKYRGCRRSARPPPAAHERFECKYSKQGSSDHSGRGPSSRCATRHGRREGVGRGEMGRARVRARRSQAYGSPALSCKCSGANKCSSCAANSHEEQGGVSAVHCSCRLHRRERMAARCASSRTWRDERLLRPAACSSRNSWQILSLSLSLGLMTLGPI